ncbi:MAG: DNA mismatch repair protein MutS, partial [Anaerolineales bacterium]|nr:DNA mismatch repair protein MutS [Anaerolineales bacterium]
MTKKDVTPIRKQYLEIKRQYPESLLFFRLGDFYETFDEDAEIVSQELDIVLTSRRVGKGIRVPMSGIPHHAIENHLSRLIDQGYHVAICEQVGDHPVNGLMPREVVRVVTPGTILEPSLLPGDANNYLACVVLEGKRAGVSYVDITTGEFAVTELEDDHIWDIVSSELLRLHPAETLFPENLSLESSDLPSHLTRWPAWRFEKNRCQSVLEEMFQVATLDGFGVRGHPLAIRAAGAVAQYLEETRPESVKLLSTLNSYSLHEFMTLDSSTRRNLELTETIRTGEMEGSLLGVLDCTVTPMGKRLLRQWVSKPLLEVKIIRKRHHGVAHFHEDGVFRAEIREELKSFQDLERLINRVLGGSAQPRDLVGVRETLQMLPDIEALISAKKTADTYLGELMSDFSLCKEALQLLEDALQDDPPAVVGHMGIIKKGYSEELDDILDNTKHARDWIKNLESVEKERTGINTLKVGHNKVYGYYIEVTKAKTDLVPEEYARKQTLVNAERYVTPELKEYETKVLNAEEQIREVERKLFHEVCGRLCNYSDQILATARIISHLDVLSALAETAANNGYVKPEVVEEDVLDVRNGRHPVVEQTLVGKRFVPNDTIFEEG